MIVIIIWNFAETFDIIITKSTFPIFVIHSFEEFFRQPTQKAKFHHTNIVQEQQRKRRLLYWFCNKNQKRSEIFDYFPPQKKKEK